MNSGKAGRRDSKMTQSGPRISLVGLTHAEAAERLRVDGPNELARQGQRTFFGILLDVLREPMLALLLGAGLIYLALGDVHEALILVGFAGLSIVITVVQEAPTHRLLSICWGHFIKEGLAYIPMA